MRMRGLFAAAVIGGVLAVGGFSAFTASNSLPASTVTKGYGSQTITGVSATAVDYNTNTAGDTITSVGLTLTGDTTARTIQIAFNDAAPATCSDAGAYSSPSTTYTCVVNQAVSTGTKFALVAS